MTVETACMIAKELVLGLKIPCHVNLNRDHSRNVIRIYPPYNQTRRDDIIELAGTHGLRCDEARYRFSLWQ